MSYVEFPVDRITNVHFKSKKAPNCHDNPETAPPPPYVNTDGYGAGQIVEVAPFDPGLIGAINVFGPKNYPPFGLGTSWNTIGLNGPIVNAPLGIGIYGGLGNPLVSNGQVLDTTFTSNGIGLPDNILLDEGQMFFTGFAAPGAPPDVNLAFTRWVVPMCEGAVCVNQPRQESTQLPDGSFVLKTVDNYLPFAVVVDRYKFDIQWGNVHAGPFSPGNPITGIEIAFQLTHPTTPAPGAAPLVQLPTQNPQFGPFNLIGGSASFEYEFKYNTWLKTWAFAPPFGTVTIDDSNKTDLSLGGPVLLWCQRRFLLFDGTITEWTGTTFAGIFGGEALIGAGDTFAWNISATMTNQLDAP